MIIIANFGLPLLLFQLPAMLMALVPIIYLEVWAVRSRLNLSRRHTFGAVTTANLVSTLIGIPVAWFILMVLQQMSGPGMKSFIKYFHNDQNSPLWAAFSLLTGFTWISPRPENRYWMVPIAAALMLLPSYLASVWLERPICRRWWSHLDPALVSQAVTHANRLSYAALFFFTCVWLVWGVLRHV
jgi:hypothetical protein